MLDIKYIRENPGVVKENCARRGARNVVDELLEVDGVRLDFIRKIQELETSRRAKSKTKPSPEVMQEVRRINEEIDLLQKESVENNTRYQSLLESIPNLTHSEVPSGGENDYKVLDVVGDPPKFAFSPKDHEQLFLNLGLIDFERGAKVAGNKFYFTKGALVLLNQALIRYGISVASRHGFVLMETPDLAKNEILSGIGFAPRGPESQVYSVEGTDLSLIGTAEITVGGYHSGEILDLSDGPKKYAALSHCFRTEAGAYGRESKGLYRVHQFTKLELFVYCTPDESEAMHKEILAVEREIVDGLHVPYRVIDVASGDLGAPAYRKFDIEAWMVMKDGYGEITSASNCTDYQARRLGIRYRTSEGNVAPVHTLNGTAVVTSRLPIAIAENYQNEDGTIRVPEVLRQYLDGLDIIRG